MISLFDLYLLFNSFKFQAARVLIQIAAVSTEQTRAMIQAGVIPLLVNLLKSPVADVKEQAIQALGCIAAHYPDCRDGVLNCGALLPLLQVLQESNQFSSIFRCGVWTLSQFCSGNPQPQFDVVKTALPTLAKLICIDDEEVITDSCSALYCVSKGTNVQAVIDASVCPRVVELLDHPSEEVHTLALRIIGNIVSGDEHHTQLIIDCGALPFLKKLLQSAKKGIRRDACYAISNITAGTKSQIQSVIDAGIIVSISNLLKNPHTRFDIKKEAAWAISNATSGCTSDQMKYLIRCRVIKGLCDLLNCEDNRLIMVALEVSESIQPHRFNE